MERDEEDRDIRIVKQVKNSLDSIGPDLVFEIRPETGFRWLETEHKREPVQKQTMEPELPKNKHELAAILLKKALADGPVEAAEIKRMMSQYRIGEKTFGEVKSTLGIKSYRKMRKWYWTMPSGDDKQ